MEDLAATFRDIAREMPVIVDFISVKLPSLCPCKQTSPSGH
jgi:hypothetical protein